MTNKMYIKHKKRAKRIRKKLKKILEIGTFTGLSALSMSLALPDDGKLIALDKNKETNKIALNFFNKANQEKKILQLKFLV